jgi:hypothetical protein
MTAMTHLPRRRFVQISRTVQANGAHTIDAIDDDGRAWWLVAGHEDAPEEWTELLPLPSREDRP